MILSPGRQPVTRSEKSAIKEIANELLLYQQDLENFYKQAIPIVNFYNSRDHYTPSYLIFSELHNQWKILAQSLLQNYTPKVNMKGNIFTMVNFINMGQIENSSSNLILKAIAQKNNKNDKTHKCPNCGKGFFT